MAIYIKESVATKRSDLMNKVNKRKAKKVLVANEYQLGMDLENNRISMHKLALAFFAALSISSCSNNYYKQLRLEKFECRDSFTLKTRQERKILNCNIDSVLESQNCTQRELLNCSSKDSLIIAEFAIRNKKKEKIGTILLSIQSTKVSFYGQSFIIH